MSQQSVAACGAQKVGKVKQSRRVQQLPATAKTRSPAASANPSGARRRQRRKQIDLILHRLRLPASPLTLTASHLAGAAPATMLYYTRLLAFNCIPRLIKSSGGGGCQDCETPLDAFARSQMKKRLKRGLIDSKSLQK